MPKKFKHKDTIFHTSCKVKDFKFTKKVVDVFDEMLDRSVPFYNEIQRMVSEITQEFAQEGTAIYDLGCSTGNTMLSVASILKKKNVKIIGLDNSLPMLEHTKTRLIKGHCWDKCELCLTDLNQIITFKDPSVIILVLTLQFVRPLQRETLIRQIFENLNPNGCLVVVEKVLGVDSLTTRLFIDLYHDFKKRNGYSGLEIAKKREALENILIPFTIEENKQLLRRNGFPIVDTFFNWYNFAGFIGVKQ